MRTIGWFGPFPLDADARPFIHARMATHLMGATGTAARPALDLRRIGRESRPLIVIDDFDPDPAALRAAAAAARFEAAVNHYPGIRAPLPEGYLDRQMPLIAAAARTILGTQGKVRLIDASFSMVTMLPAELSIRQRLPHCDAFDANRVALVHYLSPEGGDGTAFFRHRSTEFETVDEGRAPVFFGQLEAELRHGGLPSAAYVAGDTALFERIALAEGRYNRGVLYPSYLLHSGAIAKDAALSADPVTGRLTVTAFLIVE